MRIAFQNRLWLASLLVLTLGWAGCRRSKPLVSEELGPVVTIVTNQNLSRAIPRRTNVITLTNVQLPTATQPAPPTNTPPVVTCGPAQTFSCSSADGLAVMVAIHVEDANGDALTVVWSADGRERFTQQVPAGPAPTSTNLTFSYTYTPGDHGVQVSASDGAASTTCQTSVTVQKDTQVPVIACPKNLSVMTDPGQCTAVVTFQPQATDNCPDLAIACDPPSGNAFPIGVTTVNCTATDAAGNVGSCAFDVQVRFSNMCPQNDAFWRQNPGLWPVSALTLGNQVYSKNQLMSILHVTTSTDASLTLARQLIAAGLNTARGSDPRPICGQLARANDLLAGFPTKLPYRINLSLGAARPMLSLAAELGSYNRGLFTPNCVP